MNIDWKDLLKRAAWTFVEAFLVALPSTYAVNEDGIKAAWISALLSAAAAGVSAVKTLLVNTIKNGIQEQSAVIEEEGTEQETQTETTPATTPFKVYLSPSGQYGNTYAWGDTSEGVQCVKIAKACEEALVAHGVTVGNGADKDYAVRYAEAKALEPNLYMPIHTNAFNGVVSGTRMFVRSFDSQSYTYCKAIFERLNAATPGQSSNIKEVTNLEELNVMHTYGINACYAECDFHDVPSVAEYIVGHTTEIGEAIAHGICDGFGIDW